MSGAIWTDAKGLDFTTPMGKVMLGMLALLAEYYSENLGLEIKKGKAERKAQGLYNGLLPFGVKKNSQGVPVPDPETYPGLLLA
ncbi:MAG: recombinase family protein, partial [Dehalococcoidia bacterium]